MLISGRVRRTDCQCVLPVAGCYHTLMAFPPFRPHPFVRGGHAQTVAAVFWPGRLATYRALERRLRLDDDDVIVLHDDQPPDWRPGNPAALLVHGLAGSHKSP